MSGFLGHRELLLVEDRLATWERDVLATVRRPRGSWRTLFLTTDRTIWLERPDGARLLGVELTAGNGRVEHVDVLDAAGERFARIPRRPGGLTGERFEIFDGAGAVAGEISGSGVTQEHTVRDARRTDVARGSGTEGDRRVSLSPQCSAPLAAAFVGFNVAYAEWSLRHVADI
ncbi:hypothetical protein [Actinomadura parmotrematis]|uniref:Uncharacterized protein n=1 Tax=Actinomadura parmotrematis TaxID=2864039 RepID=A0ABS7FYQ8_9ACTN|nr:hypothetical protein [Actinomadura parmotrematis]MBW8485275.1 hypothetical protein [Actinomadura parmotrematis]